MPRNVTRSAVIKLTMQAKSAESGLRKLAERFGFVSKSATGAAAKLKVFALGAVAIGTAVAGMVTGLVIAAKRVSAIGDELAKTSRRVGIAAGEFQKLTFHARLAGSDIGILKTSLTILQRNLFDVSKGVGEDAIRAFEALGVSAVDTAGNARGVMDVMFDIADALQRVQNPTVRTASLMKLLGRSGSDMANFFEGGRAAIEASGKELERLGGVISDKVLKQTEEFQDAQLRLNTALLAFKLKVIGPLLGPLTSVVNKLASLGAFFLSTESAAKKAAEQVGAFGDRVAELITLREALDKLAREGVPSAGAPTVAEAERAAPAIGERAPSIVAERATQDIRKAVAEEYQRRVDEISAQFQTAAELQVPDIEFSGLDELLGRIINTRALIAVQRVAQTEPAAEAKGTTAGAINAALNRLSRIKKESERISSIFQSMGSALARAFTDGKEGIRSLGEFFKSFIIDRIIGGLLAEGLGAIFKKLIPGGSFFGKILGLQHGGIVRSPTIAALAERGRPEVVIPLDKLSDVLGQGGAPAVFDVHVSNATPETTVTIIERDLRARRRLFRNVVLPEQRAYAMR